MSIHDLAQALYDTDFATSLRESQYTFPIVEGTHLLSLSVSFGLIAITDLRLIGAYLRDEPAGDVLRQLRPWVLGGFAVTFLTGFALFAAEAVKLLDNPALPVKLALIVLAGLNALWFELRQGGNLAGRVVPRGAKLAGWVSLILWTLVVVSGRLIPYLS
jgi:hypothetical protein